MCDYLFISAKYKLMSVCIGVRVDLTHTQPRLYLDRNLTFKVATGQRLTENLQRHYSDIVLWFR